MSILQTTINSLYSGLQLNLMAARNFGALWQRDPSFVQNVALSINAALQGLHTGSMLNTHKYVELSNFLECTKTFDLVEAIIFISTKIFNLTKPATENIDRKDEPDHLKSVLANLAECAIVSFKIGLILDYINRWKVIDLTTLAQKIEDVPILRELKELAFSQVLITALSIYYISQSLITIKTMSTQSTEERQTNPLMSKLIYQLSGSTFYTTTAIFGAHSNWIICAYKTYKVLYQIIEFNESKKGTT